MSLVSEHPHVSEGFPGQRLVVLPPPVARQGLAAGPVADLLATDIGCFPDAAWHEVKRESGAAQMIVIYGVRGVGWARSAGQDWQVQAGDVLILPPHIFHAYGSGGRNPWTIYWAHMAGSKIAAILRHLTEMGKPTYCSLVRNRKSSRCLWKHMNTCNKAMGRMRC